MRDVTHSICGALRCVGQTRVQDTIIQQAFGLVVVSPGVHSRSPFVGLDDGEHFNAGANAFLIHALDEAGRFLCHGGMFAIAILAQGALTAFPELNLFPASPQSLATSNWRCGCWMVVAVCGPLFSSALMSHRVAEGWGLSCCTGGSHDMAQLLYCCRMVCYCGGPVVVL